MAKKNTNSSQKQEMSYMDLLYMTSGEVNAKDIAALFQGKKEFKVEVWDEVNVLELELSNQNSVDFEQLDINTLNSTDLDYIRNKNIHTIFSVNLCESDFNQVKAYFEQIIEAFSGFLCADTEDFNPIYVGTTAKQE